MLPENSKDEVYLLKKQVLILYLFHSSATKTISSKKRELFMSRNYNLWK